MTVVKIAVSLPERLVAHARRRVHSGGAQSVSAYVAGAIEQRASLEDLEALLREMLAESGGPLRAAERRAADEALGRSGSKPARARKARAR